MLATIFWAFLSFLGFIFFLILLYVLLIVGGIGAIIHKVRRRVRTESNPRNTGRKVIRDVQSKTVEEK